MHRMIVFPGTLENSIKLCATYAARKNLSKRDRASLQNVVEGYPMQIVAVHCGTYLTINEGGMHAYMLVASDYIISRNPNQ